MKFCIRPLLVWMVVLSSIGNGLVAAQKKVCSQPQAMQADSEVDKLKSWISVYKFYKQFSLCDDGGTAEGVSDAIAKLLANHWEHFGELSRLAANDKGFEHFVIGHVDETLDWGQDVPRIRENTLSRCPKESAHLCKLLAAKTIPNTK